VLFNYYFPGLLPDPTKIPKDFVDNRELVTKLEKALDASPEKAAALRHQNDLKSNRDLADTLGFLVYLIKELDQRAGGNPFDARNTIYDGTLDDNVTNDAIPRYAADAKRWPTSAATTSRPAEFKQPAWRICSCSNTSSTMAIAPFKPAKSRGLRRIAGMEVHRVRPKIGELKK